MPARLLALPLLNLVECCWDIFREGVEAPQIGSVVYCDLAAGYADHSGIYVGNNQIVHLDGNGCIEVASPKRFVRRLHGFNTAISIYISCKNKDAVGSDQVAQRALDMSGEKIPYNVFLNNCHRFTSCCLSGNSRSSFKCMWMLKAETQKILGSDNWRVWKNHPIQD